MGRPRLRTLLWSVGLVAFGLAWVVDHVKQDRDLLWIDPEQPDHELLWVVALVAFGLAWSVDRARQAGRAG